MCWYLSHTKKAIQFNTYNVDFMLKSLITSRITRTLGFLLLVLTIESDKQSKQRLLMLA